MTDDQLGKRRILVIDDEEAVVCLVARVLKGQGYEVDTALDGSKGIQMVNARSYDLIIADLKMPEVAGMDIYHHIENHHPAQLEHVVFFSGDVVSPPAIEFLDRARRPYLVKPFTIQELLSFVESVLI